MVSPVNIGTRGIRRACEGLLLRLIRHQGLDVNTGATA